MDSLFKLTYNKKDNDYIFDIDSQGNIHGEFALVFTDDISRYTAGIFKQGSAKISVAESKIAFADSLSIVNINTDQKLFEQPWEETAPVSEVATEDNSDNYDFETDDDIFVKDVDFISEESDDSANNFSLSSVNTFENVLNKFLDAFATAKENRSLPDNPFASVTSKEIPFYDVYEKCENVNIPNHDIFTFDSANPENSNVRVRFGNEYISAESLFLGYSNGILADYPDKILGTAKDSRGNSYNVFGILGENKNSHRPFDGMTGFNYFFRLPDSDLGYWLMYLNSKTGALCNEQ